MLRSWVGLALGTVLALAGVAGAAPADKHVTLEGDNGEGCLGDQKVDCFRVTNGTLEDLEQGMRVHLILENVGSAPHNAYAANGSDADPANVDTPADVAINNTDTVEGGENTSMMFQVPDGASSLYIWCDVDGHEAGGMWINASVAEASDASPEEPSNGTGDSNGSASNGSGDGGGEEQSSIPGAGVLAAMAAGLAASRLARRE